MLNASEAMANIRRDDEQKTANKHGPVERALDLLAQRVALDDQLAAVKQTLSSTVGELLKLMSLEEFARHAGLSKAEKALLQDLDQNPRTKPRAHSPAAPTQHGSPRRTPEQRPPARDHAEGADATGNRN